MPHATNWKQESIVTEGPSSAWQSLPPFPDDIPTAPLITLSLARLQSSDQAEIAALFKCAKELGFFYLDLMGSPEGERLFADAQALLKLQKEFFEPPKEEKDICDRELIERSHGFYGYKAIGKLIMDRSGHKDRHESYNLKKDDIVGNTTPLPAPKLIKDNMPLFESYALNAYNLILLMLGQLNDSLGLPPNTLGNLHRLHAESGDHVRFIRAPAQPAGDRGQSGGAHTDFGSLTILFNWLGGLQVQLPDQTEWVYVRPVPGCAIVNLGDAMVKFTAGIFRSNIHRVVNPPGAQAEETRYSLVYFSRPEDSVPMTRLKGGLIDEQPELEENGEVLTSQQWILKRGLANKATKDWTPEDWEKSRGTEGGRSDF